MMDLAASSDGRRMIQKGDYRRISRYFKGMLTLQASKDGREVRLPWADGHLIAYD